jgi:hypothetical protein
MYIYKKKGYYFTYHQLFLQLINKFNDSGFGNSHKMVQEICVNDYKTIKIRKYMHYYIIKSIVFNLIIFDLFFFW